jgi:hypothetical protein
LKFNFFWQSCVIVVIFKFEKCTQVIVIYLCTFFKFEYKNLIIINISKERKFITIADLELTISEREIIHNLQIMKDKTGISRRKFIQQRKCLKRCNIIVPAESRLAHYRKHLMDKVFNLKQNENGNGYKLENCSEKIEFYLKKYYQRQIRKIESNPADSLTIQQIIPNDTFYLKLAGDGASLNQSQVNILNFTFTIINDIENAMSVNGNYVLGKKNFVSSQKIKYFTVSLFKIICF